MNLESKTPANVLKHVDATEHLTAEKIKSKKTKEKKSSIAESNGDATVQNVENIPLFQKEKKEVSQEKPLRNVRYIK